MDSHVPLRVLATRWTLDFDGVPPDLTPGRLRGAILIRYRRKVCPRSRWDDPCDACPHLADCSYGQVFVARPAASDVLRRNRTLPRPYLFRADLERRDRFSLVLVGSAAALLPRFGKLFRELGRIGLTRDGPPFTVRHVEQLTGQGWRPLEGEGVPEPLPIPELVGEAVPLRRVQIHFLTPASIRSRGRAVRRPEPAAVISRLRDRLAALSAVWCGEEPAWNYRGLGMLAERVVLEKDGTTWRDAVRRSGTSGLRYPVSGFVGRAVWDGIDQALWPLLLAGQVTGVGRHCPFGSGWYLLLHPRTGRPLTPHLLSIASV